jgi:hypothetical protein
MEEKTEATKTTVAMVPVKIDENTIIYIEAVAKESDVVSEQYIDFEIPSFQDVTDAIKSFAKSIAGIWHEIRPSKATVEFGVEIGFEPGKLTAFFVKGSGKGNLKITLEWAKEPEMLQTP